MSEWDSRNKSNHWIKCDWLLRESLTPGYKNMSHPALVDTSNMILPPLHIKQGLMKQFVKVLNKEGACFKYIQEKFSNLSAEKVKERVFVGPQIRKFTKDLQFLSTMMDMKKKHGFPLQKWYQSFLATLKDSDYQSNVKKRRAGFEALGCRMSLKVHFLHVNLEYFPQNFGDMSKEHQEMFSPGHQNFENLVTVNCCWCLKRNCKSSEVASKAKRKKFMPHINQEKKNNLV